MRHPARLGVLLMAITLAAGACARDDEPDQDPEESPAAQASEGPLILAGEGFIPQAERMTTPLALVVHRSRPQLNIPIGTAQAVIDGAVADWAALGAPPETLQVLAGPHVLTGNATRLQSDADVITQVSSQPGAVGLVAAGAATPLVRALLVEGVDPLRSPESYVLSLRGQPAGKVTSVTLVGDVMLGRRVGAAMERTGDFAAPLRPTAERLAAADVTIANFEATLSRDGAPTQGGDSFAADLRVAAGLQLAGIDVLSLANNHVGDWGSRALVQTVQAVRDMGIQPVGAGADLAEARSPVVLDIDGVRVGVLATDSIGESPAAGEARPGTNRLNMPPRTGPLDQAALDRIVGDVAALRSSVDLLLVMTHWGTQYTHTPEPVQREVGRAMIGAGADIVVGGHPHWVQGVELVDPDGGRFIVHSLGNFIFDMDFMRRTQEGVFLEVIAWDGDLKAVEFVPYVIGSDFAPRVVDGQQAAEVLEPFRATSDAPFNAG